MKHLNHLSKYIWEINLRLVLMFMLLALGLSLSACKTAYAPTSLTGGYSVFPIDHYTYRITVSANRFTNINEAEGMALLKASEITLKSGYRRFIVTSNAIKSKSVSTATPSYLAPLLAATPGSSRPAGDITIRVLTQTDPDYTRGLDAVEIYRRLKPQLDRKGPKF